MLLLPYDFETSGMPLWSEPSDHPDQPHIVQVAAALVDADTRQTVASIDLIAAPTDWTIPDEVVAIHGITNERARAVGVPEQDLVNVLFGMWTAAGVRIGHNETFDARIMRIALKRFMPDLYFAGDDGNIHVSDKWKAAHAECTANMATPLMKMGATVAMKRTGRGGQAKRPKLTEAYEHFIGRPLENAHSARADMEATLAVYWAIKDLQGAGYSGGQAAAVGKDAERPPNGGGDDSTPGFL